MNKPVFLPVPLDGVTSISFQQEETLQLQILLFKATLTYKSLDSPKLQDLTAGL